MSIYQSGGLKVIYPELDIDRCLVIPKELRKKISTLWQAPEVYFPQAHKVRGACVCPFNPPIAKYVSSDTAIVVWSKMVRHNSDNMVEL